MRKAFIKTLIEIARSDPRVMLMTADLGFMVLEDFQRAYPERFFNVGVAEANMIGLATGLASCGYLPFTYSIATFATLRPYEQIRNGPVLHHLPVRIVGTGGGFEYGHAGPTHAALEDLAITRIQPGLTVIAPADHLQAATAIRATYDLPGPIYYRIGKNEDYTVPGLEGRFSLGRLNLVREGKDVLILSIGSITAEAFAAVESLSADAIAATMGVVSSIRPAPFDDLCELLPKFRLAVTVEEHYTEGGLGSLVAEVAAGCGSGCRVLRLGARTLCTPKLGSMSYMRDASGLSRDRIAASVREALQDIG
ncbi:MAG: 1-deoxy-D-xylulose-5-phosphate synthase [Candidatus Aureabacteria bacterium]|nr:1-deoxy-D-xylulose-5-phosphate synthase [Candidatus Auribacterota bacterium]